MKQLLVVLGLLTCRLLPCQALPNVANADAGQKVEVIYFHGKQRCPTCLAIEKNTREVVEKQFADEVKAGKVCFVIVDISTPEGAATAKKYRVTWSSLFVNRWKDGKEQTTDLTQMAFKTARKQPDAFCQTLEKQIREQLE